MSEFTAIKPEFTQTTLLGDMFRINTRQISPSGFRGQSFTHYSIPAYDLLDGPSQEPAETIESNKFHLTQPCVLVSKLNPRKPRVKAVHGPEAWTCASTEFICLEPRQTGTNLRFWEAFFSGADFSARLARVAVGSTNSHTRASPKETLSWLIPVVPVATQSKIAEILDTLDEAIRGTEAVVGKLKAAKQGLLHDLLTRGITAQGHLRPPQTEAPHLYHQTPLGWLPKEWEACLLDQVAQRGSGHTPSKSSPSYWNGGIKWVSLADSHRLDKIYISETDKEVSEAGLANSSAVLHPENTVILSRDAGIGKSAILAFSMAVSQHFIAWRCGARLNSVFLYYVLQLAKPKFEGIAMGSTIKTIGLSFFKKYSISLPPSHEQDRASEAMLNIEHNIETQVGELAKLRAMKSGLMEDLLTGRVSVQALL